ncbi:MAG: helix-turn-helix transcriptional regulator [Bacteroidales bacterium]
MPINKHSFARYQVIDACIRNRQRSYPDIGYLIERCSKRLDQQISRSTIEKDLKAMKDEPEPGYYAPIRYDRLKCGYYYEDPEYSISNIQVEEEDIDAIEFAARILRQYRGFHMVKRYAEAIDRILDVVDVRRILSMEEFEEYVQFDTPVYMDGSGFLEPVIKAIKDKQVLSITHQSFSKTEPVIRAVHPYLLKEYQNRWYLVGLDEQENEIRTFGLDRIKKLEQLSNIKYRRSNFDPATFFKHTIGIIAPQSKPPTLKIEFTKQQAQYLITQPIHPSQKVLKETKDMVIFTFAVHPTYEFISLLLGYRDKVKVLSPMWLRKGMKELLEQMINKYQ